MCPRITMKLTRPLGRRAIVGGRGGSGTGGSPVRFGSHGRDARATTQFVGRGNGRGRPDIQRPTSNIEQTLPLNPVPFCRGEGSRRREVANPFSEVHPWQFSRFDSAQHAADFNAEAHRPQRNAGEELSCPGLLWGRQSSVQNRGIPPRAPQLGVKLATPSSVWLRMIAHEN